MISIRTPLKVFLLSLVILLASLYSASAWSGYTHEWICVQAGLEELNCRAADNVSVQKDNPGLGFVNHHCTLNGSDCSARVQAQRFLEMDTLESRGFAAHLYADSLVPAHWYSTDYDDCHGVFEDAVEEKLRNAEYYSYTIFGEEIDMGDWHLSIQCETKDKKTVELYADDEYMESVAGYVAAQLGEDYSPPERKVYDLTPVVIGIFVFIIILFVLFIVFAFKNRRR